MTDALWYLGRGTGVVSLVLLTLVVALGIATRSGRPLPGLPRFAVTAVHRSASPLAVVFLLVHVGTLLFDPYAQLDVLALVVPFTAGAQPFWYGLGALAHIDWTRCEGRGGCVDLLPELMGRDDHGYPLTSTDVALPSALAAHARQAVRDCPRMALRLKS